MDLGIVPTEILSTKGCPQTVGKDYLKVRDEKEVFCLKEGGNWRYSERMETRMLSFDK